LFSSIAFAQSDFSAFWKEFKSGVIAGDKAKVTEMTKFPLSMPYSVKAVKNKQELLRRYNDIVKGDGNAAQCFAKAQPRKEAGGRYEIYCPLKKLRTTWKTRRFGSCSNWATAVGKLPASTTSMNKPETKITRGVDSIRNLSRRAGNQLVSRCGATDGGGRHMLRV